MNVDRVAALAEGLADGDVSWVDARSPRPSSYRCAHTWCALEEAQIPASQIVVALLLDCLVPRDGRYTCEH